MLIDKQRSLIILENLKKNRYDQGKDLKVSGKVSPPCHPLHPSTTNPMNSNSEKYNLGDLRAGISIQPDDGH